MVRITRVISIGLSVLGLLILVLAGIMCIVEINVTATGTGSLQAWQKVELRTMSQGVVKYVHPANSHVNKGDVVVALDTELAERELQKTDKDIAALEADLSQAIRDSERGARRSREQIQQAKAALELAQAKLDALQATPLSLQIATADEKVKQQREHVSIAKLRYDAALELAKKELVSQEEIDERKSDWLVAESELKVRENELALLREKLRRDDVKMALAEKAKAEAELAYAKILGSSEDGIRALKARIEKAKIEREILKTRVEQCQIRAPISGMLVGVEDLAVGELVNPHELLGEIVNLSKLMFEAYISELDIPMVKPGQPVEIYLDAFPYSEYGVFQGAVFDVSPLIEKEKNTAACKVRIEMAPTTAALKPGMSGVAEIITGRTIIVKYLLGKHRSQTQQESTPSPPAGAKPKGASSTIPTKPTAGK